MLGIHSNVFEHAMEVIPKQGSEEVDSAGTSPTAAPTPCRSLTRLTTRSLSFSDCTGEVCEHDEHSSDEVPSCLRLHVGAIQIPHPDKIDHGGEDSYFVCGDGATVGVADGVSEWGWRFGVNPRGFADELMQAACREAQQTLQSADVISVESRAQRILSIGFDSVKAFGAATALVATLDAEGSRLGVANLGDSGLLQLRRSTTTNRTEVVGRTAEQLHSFNKPYQLTRLPAPADFPRLYSEGKTALVQAVKRCRPQKFDSPCDSDTYSLKVQVGDLIILGSDGVFDNLHDSEICALVDGQVSRAVDRTVDPECVANAIAEAAKSNSQDKTADTPFGQYVREAGFEYSGGIQDDITVLAAWISN
mmetsp:Transcript_48251/g.121524  ORF Transcript_48251/g.121524 Transcript_48251/m.121524 type:complete len:363 (+) Transcript_48251:57-1145(+)